MCWKIIYPDHMDNWLKHLTKRELKSIAKELRLLELCGNKLKLPHSKALGSGLFELRERQYGLRIYYMHSQKTTIVLLQAGNKTTQRKDIKKARKFLKEYREN